jgi:hypothetical protein
MRNGTDSIDSLNNPAQDIRYVNNVEHKAKRRKQKTMTDVQSLAEALKQDMIRPGTPGNDSPKLLINTHSSCSSISPSLGNVVS